MRMDLFFAIGGDDDGIPPVQRASIFVRKALAAAIPDCDDLAEAADTALAEAPPYATVETTAAKAMNIIADRRMFLQDLETCVHFAITLTSIHCIALLKTLTRGWLLHVPGAGQFAFCRSIA